MELSTELLFIWIPCAISILYFLVRTSSHRRQVRLPPGPRPLPIIGNLLAVGDKPHRSLAALAKVYGPVMSLRLGQVLTVVVSTPAAARQALQKLDHALSGRSVPDATVAFDQHKIATSFHQPDAHWRSLRKLYAIQLFTAQRLNANRALRQRKVSELVSDLRRRSGQAVDVGEAAFSTILNMISNTVFSTDMVGIGSATSHRFKDLLWSAMEEAGAPNVSDFFPVIAGLDVQGRRRNIASTMRKMHEVFDEVIERRLSSSNLAADDQRHGDRDFLDYLIRFERDGGDDVLKMDRRTMNGMLFELFLAGSDTSSNTLEWSMTELLCNPASMERAQAEIAGAVAAAGREVDESDIPNLPYLQAVVKETLRLHPPTPFLLPRRAQMDVDLCGFAVPEGTRVLVNAWAIGRDEEAWTNPNAFVPERFVGSAVNYKGGDFELIPFGAGRRICPGLPLASRMVPLMLASLLESFKWELPEGIGPMDVDMTEKFGITLAKAVPLRAIPTAIEPYV